MHVEIADTSYWRRNIPCQDACPVHTDARGYVRAIAAGQFEQAYLIARGPNPLASMCGRVCGAPCEAQCRRGQVDKPIAIRTLKRFVTERYGPKGDTMDSADLQGRLGQLSGQNVCDGIDDIRHLLNRRKEMTFAQPDGARVAIIGAGPAGLACAHDLCLLGLRPVIFEMESVPAGMLYVGVPEYRLPRDVILGEVAVIEAMGTEIRCGVEVGKDITLPEVLSEFKATVIAVGAKKSRQLPIDGVEGPGVLGGVEFLKDVAYDRPVALGSRVVVIGGGNVAYDAARTTLRQSYVDISRTAKRQEKVETVYLACLESREEMPADDVEIIEGDEEGVIRKSGWGPTAIVRNDEGKVTGVEFQRCLRAFNDEGRFAPIFDANERMTLECDTVIVTIGQSIELPFIDADRDGIRLTERGMMEIDKTTLAASREGVFAAGDIVMGMGLMIDAIAFGKQAARSVHQYVTGEQASRRVTDEHHLLADFSREAGFEGLDRVATPMRPVAERIKSQKLPAELGYDQAMAAREASRCLDCGVNTIFDGTKCILCGGCGDVCPMLCLKLVPAASLGQTPELSDVAARTRNADAWREGAAIIKDETRCIRCGHCAERCPVGAITMERFCFQEQAL